MDNLDPLLQSELGKILRARRHSLYFKIILAMLVVGLYATIVLFPGAMLRGFDGLSGGFSAEDDSGKVMVPLVRINGMIAPGKPASLARLKKSLNAAFNYDAKGVILAINSPGGTPAQSMLIHDEILRLKAKHNKEVVVVTEDTLASGAFLIAMSADTIYSNQASTVGSIGVIMRSIGMVGLADKIGIESRVYTAGESKSRFDPLEPVSQEDRAKAEKMLTEIHRQFKEIVVAGRGERIDPTNESLFSGDFWTGREALELGLVDGLAGMSEVVIDHFSADGTIEHKPQFGFEELMEFLKDGMGVSVMAEANLKPGVWLLPAAIYQF